MEVITMALKGFVVSNVFQPSPVRSGSVAPVAPVAKPVSGQQYIGSPLNKKK
jgi:hypothetical protein